jgi:hypothetical protein
LLIGYVPVLHSFKPIFFSVFLLAIGILPLFNKSLTFLGMLGVNHRGWKSIVDEWMSSGGGGDTIVGR